MLYLVIIHALIFNLTQKSLRLHYCEDTIGYFLQPVSENGFLVVCPVISSGTCHFSLDDDKFQLMWYYNSYHAREYYGIVHDANIRAWITIRGIGEPRYYIY